MDTPTMNPGQNYQYPEFVYPHYEPNEEPDSLICEAVYRVPGPFEISESYIPDSKNNELFDHGNRYSIKNLSLLGLPKK